MILLAVSTSIALACALMLVRISEPNTTADKVAQFVLFFFGIIITVSECAGRLLYSPPALALGMLLAGAIVYWFYRQFDYREGPALPGWQDLRRRLQNPSKLDTLDVITAVTVLAWAVLALDALYAAITIPPFIADGLRYHLAGPAQWIANQKIDHIAGVDYRINYFPHAGSLLFGWPMVHLRNDVLATVANVIVSTVLAPAVIASGAQRFGVNSRLAWIIGIATATSMPFFLARKTEFVDALFWLAAGYAILLCFYRPDNRLRTAVAPAFAMGIALGTKTFGILFFPIAGLTWMLAQRVAVGPAPLVDRRHVLRGAFAATIALLIGGWSYAANIAGHGNPVFPYNLTVGPFHLSGAPEGELFWNKKVISGASSSIEKLGAVVSKYPQLVMGMKPFDKPPQNFGSGFIVLLVLAGLLAGQCLYQRLNGTAHHGAFQLTNPVIQVTSILMIINLILAAQWGAQFLDKGIADFGSAARYQAILPVLLAWWIAALVSRLPHFSRLLTVVAVCLAASFNVAQGYTWYTRSSLYSGPGVFELTRNTYLDQGLDMSPPLSFYQIVKPEERMLILGSGGLNLHFMRPGFFRYVTTGQDPNLIFDFNFDRALHLASLSRYSAGFVSCGTSEQLGRAFYSRLVRHQDIGFVLVIDGAHFNLQPSAKSWRPDLLGKGWDKVLDESKRKLRFTGYRRNSNFVDDSDAVASCVSKLWEGQSIDDRKKLLGASARPVPPSAEESRE